MNPLLQVKSGILLLAGIFLLVLVTPTYLSTVGVVAAIGALRKQRQVYGYHVWIAFDKFWNAVLGGDHRETISSRLGKSIHFGLPPVFWFLWADKVVAFLLDQVDHDHCRKSVDWGVGKGKHERY